MAATTGSVFPLLVIYDDSLHNRWQLLGNGPLTDLNAPRDAGRLWDGGSVPCGRSIRATFNTSRQALTLQSEEPVVLADSLPLILSFVFDPTDFTRQPGKCTSSPAVKGACPADYCVSVRLNSTRRADSLFLPLCTADSRRTEPRGPLLPPGWTRMEAPLDQFGTAAIVDQVVFVQGDRTRHSRQLQLDEIWLSSRRTPRAGDSPPSYGGSDINVIRRNWLQGVTRQGAANSPGARRNPHFCEYMSSELGGAPVRRPLCRMDGDQLAGRWMQTCDPRLISRPDHFAYGRALPPVKGWYDYRLCYRQSATERLRALQAITWSWRPYKCALAPVSGAQFDAWLGNRTVLFLGDSLSAQAYYSLIWLLGDHVTGQKDLYGRAPGEPVVGETVMDKCQTNVGNEGGWLSSAHLRGGGKLVKVLRHADLFTELRDIRNAFWRPFLEEADVVVLNVGHHYHQLDPTFRKYHELVAGALEQLAARMRPAAKLVFRTTNIGHYNCANATRPLRSRADAWQELTGAKNIYEWRPPQMTRRGANVGVDLFNDKYNWRGPPLFESAWERTARTMPALADRFAVLNVSFLDMRGDGHVATSMRYSSTRGEFGADWKKAFPLDCLHYCYPGPADFWALALYNLLLNNPKYQG